MMASNAIMPYAFIKPLEGEFSMSLSIRMRFPSCLFQYSGGYATADRDHIDDQRQSPFFTLRLIKNSPSRKFS